MDEDLDKINRMTDWLSEHDIKFAFTLNLENKTYIFDVPDIGEELETEFKLRFL